MCRKAILRVSLADLIRILWHRGTWCDVRYIASYMFRSSTWVIVLFSVDVWFKYRMRALSRIPVLGWRQNNKIYTISSRLRPQAYVRVTGWWAYWEPSNLFRTTTALARSKNSNLTSYRSAYLDLAWARGNEVVYCAATSMQPGHSSRGSWGRTAD